MKRDLRPNEIISKLEYMADHWPKGYRLFSTGYSIHLVKVWTDEVVGTSFIEAGGGDCGIYEQDGKKYLDL